MKKIKSKLQLLLLLPVIPILLGFWGLLEPYFIDEVKTVAFIPNLPESWEGSRVAQVSDFQVGMWLGNTNTIRRSISKLIQERPAAVLITGDFIYHSLPNPDPEINKVVELIRPLIEANIPTYAVLGNHDYSHKPSRPELAEQVETALENLGVVVLQNEAVKLTLSEADSGNLGPSQTLYLVGIGSRIAERDRVQKALAQILDESPRIAMMHNPQSFEKFPARTAPFAIAGHTHGGQIRLPFSRQWSWLQWRKKEVYLDNWIQDYGEAENKLYVNRGIGFSHLPIRFNCPPEVTFFILKSQPIEIQSNAVSWE